MNFSLNISNTLFNVSSSSTLTYDSSSESSNKPEKPAEVEAEEQAQNGDDFDYSDFEIEDGQEGWL